jgi:hypothetical protein
MIRVRARVMFTARFRFSVRVMAIAMVKLSTRAGVMA